ncbi:serine/arginine repetitive matrix protein 1-like [Brassica rapa]|uniref:serine/arginine repetitive matrix protein 1-like n=1 Tax=Brassica campestris TaxID=3711 RepID=UPI00142DDA2E|nr:serine/arginine repetitive matrix protein 1-like [Brassica rapa]
MSGKKKQKKMLTSSAKTPSPLPSQYEFVPRTQAPPPVPNRQPPPSVSDYPPPAQLFQDSMVQSRRASTPSPKPRGSQTSQPRGSQTSQPRGSQTSQPRASQTSQPRASQTSQPRASQTSLPRGSQTSATRQPQSPQSQSTSEAQNSQTAEDSEDEEFPHVEPTLSKDQMDVVNALLSQPGRERLTTLSPYLEPGTTWFGSDKGKLTRKITKIFKNKFNGQYYSGTVVPRRRQERWFVEFAKTHTWRSTLTGLVQEKFERIGQRRLKDIVSNRRTSRKRPNWIKKTLWRKICAFWDTAEAKEKSLTTSAARMSDRKCLGPQKHNSGQKSFQQIEQEMVTSFSLTKLKKNYVLIPFTLFTISGRGIGQTGDS